MLTSDLRQRRDKGGRCWRSERLEGVVHIHMYHGTRRVTPGRWSLFSDVGSGVEVTLLT